jgi:hypothetical protein
MIAATSLIHSSKDESHLVSTEMEKGSKIQGKLKSKTKVLLMERRVR